MSSAEWYYAVDGQSQGPVSQSDFDALVSNGTIRHDTLVWQEGMDDWLPLGRMPNATQTPPPMAPAWDTSAPVRDDASTFMGAFKDGLSRYVDFSTRSNRPMFWYWTLWNILLGIVSSVIDAILGFGDIGLVNALLSLALLIPSIAVSVRRLHDIGRSGWWYLLVLVPIVGWIILLVFFCTKGQETPNNWGNPV